MDLLLPFLNLVPHQPSQLCLHTPLLSPIRIVHSEEPVELRHVARPERVKAQLLQRGKDGVASAYRLVQQRDCFCDFGPRARNAFVFRGTDLVKFFGIYLIKHEAPC